MQTNLMYSLILQCFKFINNPVSGKIFLVFLVQNALESFEKCMSGDMLQGHCRQNFARYKLHIVSKVSFPLIYWLWSFPSWGVNTR